MVMRRLILLLAGLLPSLSTAALELDRYRIDIAARPGHAALWLHNADAQGWQGQARLYRWQQSQDGEHLVEATDMAVSPARLDIAPGQGQRLRVVRLDASPREVFQAYRLVLSPNPGSALSSPRISLPVFVFTGDGPAPPPRLWVSASTEGDAVILHNDGDGPARLAELTFIGADGQAHLIWPGLAGYVLPHQTRRWALPARPDRYVGGRFQARLQDQAATLLPYTAPQIAATTEGGL